MQLGRPVGLLRQAGPEQIGEQLVITPAPYLIERLQKQAGSLHLLEHLLAVTAIRDGITKGTAQRVQDRRFQEKGAELLCLAGEYLFGQVVQDVAVAATKGGHESRHVGLAPRDRAASCKPAAHPSVRADSAAAVESGSTRPGRAPRFLNSSAASPSLKRRSVARMSVSSPRARSRASASGGSERLAKTNRRSAGRCSSKKPSERCTGSESIR